MKTNEEGSLHLDTQEETSRGSQLCRARPCPVPFWQLSMSIKGPIATLPHVVGTGENPWCNPRHDSSSLTAWDNISKSEKGTWYPSLWETSTHSYALNICHLFQWPQRVVGRYMARKTHFPLRISSCLPGFFLNLWNSWWKSCELLACKNEGMLSCQFLNGDPQK